MAIPKHRDPHQLVKVLEANVAILQFEENRQADLKIFADLCRDDLDLIPSKS